MIFMVTVEGEQTIALLQVEREEDVPVMGFLIGLPEGKTKQFSEAPNIDLTGVPLNKVLSTGEMLLYTERLTEYARRNGIGEILEEAKAKLRRRMT